MKRFCLGLSCSLFLCSLAFAQTDCSFWNSGSFYTQQHYSLDTQQHQDGNHNWTDVASGNCIYTGQAGYEATVTCATDAEASTSVIMQESGRLDLPDILNSHYMQYGTGSGSATNGHGSATADTEGAVGVRSCVTGTRCNFTVGVSGTGDGGGFTVTYSPMGELWTDNHHYTNACPVETLPPLPLPVSTCQAPTSPPPDGTGDWSWDSVNCTWEWTGPCGGGGCSPIVVDTSHHGFAFSDPTKGHYVTFDLRGDGSYEKVSWPLPDSGNAWLVYDRDGDGVIKDGTDLFGNFTPHSNFLHPEDTNPMDGNGFLALGWYDLPAQGGNGDAVLDKDDSMWPKLRLWIDKHCYLTPDKPCQSEPSELHTLESVGVRSISLIYQYDGHADAVGNRYRFYAYLNPDIEDQPLDAHHRHSYKSHGHEEECCDLHQRSRDGRKVYDVYLKVVP